MALFFSSNAQEVGSKAYDIMLQGLLSHSVKEVSVNEVKDKKDVIFVDARERKEFDVSHIKGAIFVGYDSLDLSAMKKVSKNKDVIVYCSVGYRSEKVSEKLEAIGFTNVSNLYGGIFEWKNQDQPLVTPESKPTEEIHAFSRVWGIWLNKGVKVY
ncbi:MAG: rhodanese-related sulfurtransferase [Vicingaceae bacterium]|jgi:rhodanese-related sulfurtransferase